MTTYLGYQVRHLENETAALNAWLEAKRENALSIWGKTTIGSGCDYGINPENYPWGNDEIKAFEDKGDRCEFTTERETFVVEVAQLPTDRWGNTATYSEGIDLQEGCFEVCYQMGGLGRDSRAAVF